MRRPVLRSVPPGGIREPSDAGLSFELDPLVRSGMYEAVGAACDDRWLFNTWKRVLTFDVHVPDQGEPDGFRRVRLRRFYNAIGKKRGNILLFGPYGDYAREWALVSRMRPSRRDRMPGSVFVGALVRVEVTTVTKDRGQRPIPDTAQYSRIKRLVECLAGGGRTQS